MNRWDCIIKRLPCEKFIYGVEVGVFKGNMSKKLLKKIPNLFLFMVDRWKEYNEAEKTSNNFSSMSKRDQKSFDVAFIKAQKVAKKFGERAVIFDHGSITSSSFFADDFMHFVFIDADHSFLACRKDIIAWLPKIKKGGFISGHDIHRESVKAAVESVFGDNYEVDDDNTWFSVVEN